MNFRTNLMLLLCLPGLAHATDGVIEINDAKVLANGGYPYLITASGSYRLTSNLFQTNPNTSVVVIRASNVTLDLNGFAIKGNNTCSQDGGTYAVSCSASGTGAGVYLGDGTLTEVVVRNGKIVGAGGDCVDLFTIESARAESVEVAHCGGRGMRVGSGSRIKSSSSLLTADTGLQGGDIIDSVVLRSGATGISGVAVQGSRSDYNLGAGITAQVVRYSTANFNKGNGMRVDRLAVGNKLEGNVGGLYGNSLATAPLAVENSFIDNLPNNIFNVKSLTAPSNSCVVSAPPSNILC